MKLRGFLWDFGWRKREALIKEPQKAANPHYLEEVAILLERIEGTVDKGRAKLEGGQPGRRALSHIKRLLNAFYRSEGWPHEKI